MFYVTKVNKYLLLRKKESMKKREIVIVVLLIVFGVVYNVVEKGRIRFAGDFSRYFDPMRLVSDRYSEFPQDERIFPAPGPWSWQSESTCGR
jgi:hypothetical protein